MNLNTAKKTLKEQDFTELFGEEEQNYKWKPFPDHYVSKKAQVDLYIPQISTKYPNVHVIAKLTDNFEILQEFGADDNITPLKVLCWNDISSLTPKMSAKTVEAGLEREYASIHEGITFECHSVLSRKSHRSDFLIHEPDIYVFHVLDPTIPQTHKILSNRNTMISSFSTSQLSSIASGKVAPPNLEAPIQANITSLQNLSKRFAGQRSIFIFDCSFAKKSLEGILYNEESKSNPFIIFAATSHLLNYSSHLPCDLFTSCLLTPSKVALLWQSQKVGHFQSGILKEIELQTLIDQLNDSEDSNNILNMLNTALNAIADKIATDFFLTSDNEKKFYDIFRRDSFTSQLFYNYMFSTRIMTALAMDPSSFPPIMDSTQHPLWETFDLQVDRALFSLVNSLSPIHIPQSIFITENLLNEAMEKLQSWLRFPISGRKIPYEISYLPMLLLSPIHFKPAIIFCSNFIQISEKAAKTFLYTRSFPVLPSCLNRIEKSIDMFDAETIAAFSFVVADSVLLVPKLAEYFKPKTSFWFRFIPNLNGTENSNDNENENENLNNLAASISNISTSLTNNEADENNDFANDDNAGSLIEFCTTSHRHLQEDRAIQLVVIASLSVLLIFLDSKEQVQFYKESNIIDSLKKLESLNTLPRIKCLANLILSQLGVGFNINVENRKIDSESNPLCRAAVLSRFQVTIQQLNDQMRELKRRKSDDIKNELEEIQFLRDSLLELVIESLNDLYPLVRENALVVISNALSPSAEDLNEDNDSNNNNDSDNENENEDADLELENIINNKLVFDQLEKCLKDKHFKPENAPTARILMKKLRTLFYDTSARVIERLIQFCFFIESKLSHDKTEPLTSNLKFSCLNKLSHLQNKDQMPKSFFNHETLVPPVFQSQPSSPFSPFFSVIQQKQKSSPNKNKFQYPLCNKKSAQDDVVADKKVSPNKKMLIMFTGKPAISPSGLLACSNIDGSITYQVQSEDNGTMKTKNVTHDWFSSPNIYSSFPHFSSLSKVQTAQKTSVSYLQFISDTKLLATSSSSQVVVIDTEMIKEPICSFCGSKPYNYSTSISDYNNHNFSLIQTSEEENGVKLYDFTTLKSIGQFYFQGEKQKIQGIQWLKPYTTLFYVARQDVLFYDTRMKEVVFKILNVGSTFVGGNVSYNSPVTFVMGNNYNNGKNKQGVISMYALGGSQITSTTITKEFKEFEVHKHLPFAAAVTDSFFSFNFDTGELEQQQQNLGYIPNSISLHHSEALVAARIGNKVQCEEINYY